MEVHKLTLFQVSETEEWLVTMGITLKEIQAAFHKPWEAKDKRNMIYLAYRCQSTVFPIPKRKIFSWHFLVATERSADPVTRTSRKFSLKTVAGKKTHNQNPTMILTQRLLRQSDKLVFRIRRGKWGRVRAAICNKEIKPFKTNSDPNHVNMARVIL